MSKARDISNLFSASTDVSTDAEVTSAIATHASNTTNRHYKAGNSASRPGSPNVGDIYTNTETGFIEIYESTGWSQVGAIASAPSSVVATNQGSGRAYNNGQASVAFSAGTVAGKTYTVTSSPGSYTNTGSSSPIVVTGLQSNTSYTYTVTATNNYGTSAASSASAAVTATTVPQAPTIGTATGGNESATLTFTAGATGGSSITNYKYSTDNSTYTAFDPAQTSSPLTISGLTNNQSYSFYLKAVNANGDSAASSASNSALIGIFGDYESIATYSVSSGGINTVTFDNIPQGYKHLQLRAIVRSDHPSDSSIIYMNFNGDTGLNYSWHYTDSGGGSNPSGQGYAGASTGASAIGIQRIASGQSRANVYSVVIVDLTEYNNTNKNKLVQSFGAWDNNGVPSLYTNGRLWMNSGAWRNTNAITSISLREGYSGTTYKFQQYSHFALYGIKG